MGGRGPYRRWPHEQLAVRYIPVVDQSTGPGFDPSGVWIAPPRGQFRYAGRPQWGQYRPLIDVSTSASFDPPDLPAEIIPRPPLRPNRVPYQQYVPRIDVSEPALDVAAVPRLPIPKGQARYGRPQWQQYIPKIDVSEPALDFSSIPPTPLPRGQARTGRPQFQQYVPKIDVSEPALDFSATPPLPIPKGQARFGRPQWAQYRPNIDVSEPALDLQALPAAPPPRAQFRPLGRPWWAQYRATMDTSAVVVFDPPDLPQQLTPRPPLRPNRVPWMQYTPHVAPDFGIRPLMQEATYDNVDRSVSYSTSSINSIGPMAIAFVGYDASAGTPPTCTLAGCGLTWTAEATDVQNVRRVTMFSGVGDASFPGALTFTLVDAGSGTACIGADWAVISLQGSDASDLVVQASTLTAASGTSLGITLLTFLDPLNRPFSYFRHRATEGTTPQTNWTELSDVNGTTPANGAETQWRVDTADVAAAASWSTSAQNLGIAAEIRALGQPVDVPPPFYTPSRGQTRPPRPAWQQYIPRIDVSEPALDFSATPPLPEPRGRFRYAGRPQWQQRSPLIDQSVSAPDLDVPYVLHPRIRPHRLPHRGPRHQFRPKIDQSSTVPNAAGEVDAFASIATIYRAVVEFIDGGMRAWATTDAAIAGEVAVSIAGGAAVSLDRVIASSVEIE